MSKSASQELINLPLSLHSIYIRKSASQIFEWFEPTIAGQKLVGKYRIDSGRVENIELVPSDLGLGKIRFCRFITAFEFLYLLEKPDESGVGDEEKRAAEINAEIAINYVITSKTAPSESLMLAWAQTNVLHHAWPYWREFCQSTLSRMNLPLVVLPLFNALGQLKLSAND